MLAATAALLAGCGNGTEVTGERADARTLEAKIVASGSAVASCEEAMLGSTRIGGINAARTFVRAGRFGLLLNEKAFDHAQPAGAVLAPGYRDLLITKTPATVVGLDPITVSIPPSARDEAGLLYGSLRSYEHSYAQITFEPCPGQNGTSWPGGLGIRTRDPVTLLVTDGTQVLWLPSSAWP